MTWICETRTGLPAADHDDSALLLSNPIETSDFAAQNDPLLAVGTVMFEIDFALGGRIPCQLIHSQSDSGWHRSFTVFLNADHSLSVEVQQGPARSYVRLADWYGANLETARVTFSWDAPQRVGMLTIECLNTGSIRQALFEAPVPLPRSDIDAILFGTASQSQAKDPRVSYLAGSDQFESVGPLPTITKGTSVETTDGYRPIERLQLGDMVLTANNGPMPVRWIIHRELPAIGSNSSIILRAPYFGLTHDIVVSQHQRVMISGVEAEYLFGSDAVMVEAKQLLIHPGASMVTNSYTQEYYQILVDVHDCIRLRGAWSESLYIGNLSSNPALMATTLLAPLAGTDIPVHRRLGKPTLRGYETRTLLDALSA